MKTRTLPESQRGAWFEGPDVVTMLRVYGTAVEFELPRDTKTFTLGSDPDHDVVIPDRFLSSLHCVLERRGQGLRVHDQGSSNGTFFDGRRESTFELRPGASFTAASIRFLALNDEVRAAHPILADLLGSEDEHALASSGQVGSSPSDLIVTATSGANILITGPTKKSTELQPRGADRHTTPNTRVRIRTLWINGESPPPRPSPRVVLAGPALRRAPRRA